MRASIQSTLLQKPYLASNNLRFGRLSDDDKALLRAAKRDHQLVSVNIDTQNGFIHPAPVNPRKRLTVTGAKTILHKVKQLVDVVRHLGIPRIDTMDTHYKGDPEFDFFNGVKDPTLNISDEHLIYGTPGWRKCKQSVLSNTPWTISWDTAKDDLPSPEQFARHVAGKNPFYLEKTTYPGYETAYNAFNNPKMDKLLKLANTKVILMDGVATDYCDKVFAATAVEKGYTVFAIRDAMKGILPEVIGGQPNPEYRIYKHPHVKNTTVAEIAEVLAPELGLHTKPAGRKKSSAA